MNTHPDFDLMAAHEYFSAHCFNRTWDYIDKPGRTPGEDREMLITCLASVWHWLQRPDVTALNLSVGYWQVSRVFAFLGDADNARQYGQLAFDNSHGLEAFYIGYAYEALARSEMVAGNRARMQEYLALARNSCEAVADPESKKLLSIDLEQIK